MRRFLFLFCLTAASAHALDWGGAVENSLAQSGGEAKTLSWNSAMRFWASSSWGSDSFQFRANMSNSFNQQLTEGNLVNTLRGDLEILSWEGAWYKMGRNDFRDFSRGVLNTKLDGIQVTGSTPSYDIRAYAGLSSLVLKGSSTIIISEDDGKDREVYEDLTKPDTLWAPPRLVAGAEVSAKDWLKDQTFQVSLLGQYDLRPDQARAGDRANTDPSRRHGAPVSTAYGGVGWNGRLFGPLYGSLWAYGMVGTSLTAVGPIETVSDKNTGTTLQFQTWSPTLLYGGLGSADLTLLAPSLSYLLVNVGAQIGTWDGDGAVPRDNKGLGETTTVTPFTGWVGISQTGGAQIFNPQPANLASGHLVVSLRPASVLQVASTTVVSARPTDGPVSAATVPESSQLYLGTESDLAVLWRPVSDVGASLSGGVFFPNQAALDARPEARIQASVTMNF